MTFTDEILDYIYFTDTDVSDTFLVSDQWTKTSLSV